MEVRQVRLSHCCAYASSLCPSPFLCFKISSRLCNVVSFLSVIIRRYWAISTASTVWCIYLYAQSLGWRDSTVSVMYSYKYNRSFDRFGRGNIYKYKQLSDRIVLPTLAIPILLCLVMRGSIYIYLSCDLVCCWAFSKHNLVGTSPSCHSYDLSFLFHTGGKILVCLCNFRIVGRPGVLILCFARRIYRSFTFFFNMCYACAVSGTSDFPVELDLLSFEILIQCLLFH